MLLLTFSDLFLFALDFMSSTVSRFFYSWFDGLCMELVRKSFECKSPWGDPTRSTGRWNLRTYSIIHRSWLVSLFKPRSGELRTQKLKSHPVRTQSLKILPLKSGVGQYIAIHATLTARVFFLAYFYPLGPFTCIFSKTSPDFFLCWLWLTPVPAYARRIK